MNLMRNLIILGDICHFHYLSGWNPFLIYGDEISMLDEICIADKLNYAKKITNASIVHQPYK